LHVIGQKRRDERERIRFGEVVASEVDGDSGNCPNLPRRYVLVTSKKEISQPRNF
jgi:hypothetical protein